MVGRRVTRSRVAIGALLIDQPLFTGIGNAYRSEPLFRRGSTLGLRGRRSRREFDGLYAEAAGSSRTGGGRVGWRLSTEPTSPRGEKRAAGRHLPPEDEASGSAVARARARETYVYKRAGLPCRRCGTEVRTEVMAGRDVYWCPTCQPPRA